MSEKLIQEALAPDEKVIKQFKRMLINLKAGNAPRNMWGQEVEKDEMAGTLAITDKRVIHTAKFLLKKSLLEIPLAMVSSVNCKKGMLTTNIQIHSSAGTRMELKTGNKKDADEVVRIINENRSAGSISMANQATSPADEIKKLSELKDQGIITEEEFENKKKDLLAKM